METIVQENIRLRNELFMLKKRIKTLSMNHETTKFEWGRLPKDYEDWRKIQIANWISTEIVKEVMTFRATETIYSFILTGFVDIVFPDRSNNVQD